MIIYYDFQLKEIPEGMLGAGVYLLQENEEYLFGIHVGYDEIENLSFGTGLHRSNIDWILNNLN